MAKFEFVNASKSYNTNVKKDPIENFISIQEDQKKAFVAEKKGETITNAKGKDVKPNWFENDGVWFYTLKYGNRKLNVAGSNSVKVGKKSDIPAAIDYVIGEAKTGVLKSIIETVATDYAKNRKK